MNEVKLSKDEVVRLVGDVADETVIAIIATGASVEDVETAVQWFASADDVMGKSGKTLTGPAAAVYEILAAEEAEDDHERQ